jgi:hypothetical protein
VEQVEVSRFNSAVLLSVTSRNWTIKHCGGHCATASICTYLERSWYSFDESTIPVMHRHHLESSVVFPGLGGLMWTCHVGLCTCYYSYSPCAFTQFGVGRRLMGIVAQLQHSNGNHHSLSPALLTLSTRVSLPQRESEKGWDLNRFKHEGRRGVEGQQFLAGACIAVIGYEVTSTRTL